MGFGVQGLGCTGGRCCGVPRYVPANCRHEPEREIERERQRKRRRERRKEREREREKEGGRARESEKENERETQRETEKVANISQLNPSSLGSRSRGRAPT